MKVNNELGKRMKEYYENIPKTKLMRRTPVAIRLDGKNFHAFTRGFQKPFDKVLIKSMQETMKYLCENIQNCVLGFAESDEITLILVDYKNLNTAAWFDYEVQKMCSIAASMATMAFNKFFAENVKHWASISGREMFEALTSEQRITYEHTLNNAVEKGAMFDARCFNIPKEEVTNLIYWRQLDAIRNSIQMVGQANFSHEELQNKSCNEIKDMLMTEKGINWNDFPTYQKRGSCCIIGEYYIDSTPVRTHWVIDEEIPIFKGENRNYIEKLIDF